MIFLTDHFNGFQPVHNQIDGEFQGETLYFYDDNGEHEVNYSAHNPGCEECSYENSDCFGICQGCPFRGDIQVNIISGLNTPEVIEAVKDQVLEDCEEKRRA